MVFLSAVIIGVDKYADLLRMSAANTGNDFRLGGHEAPPTIISIFLGEQLTHVLENIADGANPDQTPSCVLETGVATLPKLPKDDSDRNRTSPFAFTGNKFEFRMVGSSASISIANYVLNTIVADSLMEIANRLENCADFDGEIQKIVRDAIKTHGKVIFNGNNYTDDWVVEAEKRGLPNLSNTVDAIGAMVEPKNIALMERHHVMNEAECLSRYEIMLENYCKVISIEGHTMAQMCRREILPHMVEFAGKMAESYEKLAKMQVYNANIEEFVRELSTLITEVDDLCCELDIELDQCDQIEDYVENAKFHRDSIRRVMAELRTAADRAERLVSSDAWPIPTYTDLLYRV